MKKSAKRYMLIVSGSIALALGVIGVAIPLLPTTPFLLLAAFCYLRSSERLYHWLLGNRVLGPYIRNYLDHRAVKKGVKIATITLLWLALAISMVLASNIYMRIFLSVVGIGVSVHVLSLRTLRENGACDAQKEKEATTRLRRQRQKRHTE